LLEQLHHTATFFVVVDFHFNSGAEREGSTLSSDKTRPRPTPTRPWRTPTRPWRLQ